MSLILIVADKFASQQMDQMPGNAIPSKSFTNLPPEVRNAIYSLCTPVTGYMQDFRGLLLVSKQVRAEYEHEAVNTMSKFLDRIEKEWPHELELRIQRPTALSTLQYINVRLPVSIYDPFKPDSAEEVDDVPSLSRLEPCLKPLFSLCLSELSLGYYFDDGYRSPSVMLTSRLLPYGLLLDLTNILTPPSESDNFHCPLRKSRQFRLERPMRVRRLRYHWAIPDHSSSSFRTYVEKANTGFFLSEVKTWLWQEEEDNVVRNWGSSSNGTVFFDINV
ncbi:unnamed protein product [Periconia digitata]|uniref:Uncharacterized protein n=1 Tax=Periconia digitata TaxID=1303443 RepID=A0A9W4UBH3_9PLEO|nr:unnamed protein product [Periconia digitata]